MNDAELLKQLVASRVPAPRPEFLESLPANVAAGIRAQKPAPVSDETHGKWWQPVAFTAAAAACVVLALVFGYGKPSISEDGFAVLKSQKLLQEVLGMFPNRVRAIEDGPSGLKLVLSDREDVPVSTPIWVRICDGNKCSAFVTFSGQELQIAKEKVEVLVDAQDRVILIGNRFVWSSGEPSRNVGHLRIQARPLAYAM
jgi:hypothetical protein